jgi:hypothetical protein
MASYPNSVVAFTTKNTGDTIQASHIDDLQAEVTAIETGLLNGTAPLNSSNSTLVHLSVTAGMNIVGNSTLASTITIGAIPYIFPASGGSTGQLLGVGSTSGSTMTLAWVAAPAVPAAVLLKANNGTDASAGATTVDSIALSGLTANDRIKVVALLEASSQNVANIILYNVTDAVSLCSVSAAGILGSGQGAYNEVILSQRQGNSTNTVSLVTGNVAGTANSTFSFASVATPWTGTWTLGLRHGGVTAGGSLKYEWTVHKWAGQ